MRFLLNYCVGFNMKMKTVVALAIILASSASQAALLEKKSISTPFGASGMLFGDQVISERSISLDLTGLKKEYLSMISLGNGEYGEYGLIDIEGNMVSLRLKGRSESITLGEADYDTFGTGQNPHDLKPNYRYYFKSNSKLKLTLEEYDVERNWSPSLGLSAIPGSPRLFKYSVHYKINVQNADGESFCLSQGFKMPALVLKSCGETK